MVNLRNFPVILSILISGFFYGEKNVFAQEMAGLVSDRYAGINRGLINPAAIFDSPNCIDISLVTGNFSVQNNYFYLPRGEFSLSDLRNTIDRLFPDPGPYFSERLNTRRMRGAQHTRLQGPSVLFKYKGHAIGFITGARSITSLRNIPGHVMNFHSQGLEYSPQHNIQYTENTPFSVASLGWTEVGLSYATSFAGTWTNNMAVGISSRYLMGYHALSLRTDNLVYEVNEDRDVLFSSFNLTGMGSLPFDEITNEQGAARNYVKGSGVSFDLGFTFSQNSSMAREVQNNRPVSRGKGADYKYRLGFSILDIGGMRMKENVKRFEFSELNLTWPDPRWWNYEHIDELIDDLESQLVSGQITRRDDEPYWIYLPTAASLQFDYNLGANFFAYMFLVQDLPVIKNRVSRASQLGIVPRYETRWFSFAVPLTLYDYNKPRLGFSMRLAFLTIGTEQPGGMFGVNDMDGMDIYFSITWGIENCFRRNPSKIPCPVSWY